MQVMKRLTDYRNSILVKAFILPNVRPYLKGGTQVVVMKMKITVKFDTAQNYVWRNDGQIDIV